MFNNLKLQKCVKYKYNNKIKIQIQIHKIQKVGHGINNVNKKMINGINIVKIKMIKMSKMNNINMINRNKECNHVCNSSSQLPYSLFLSMSMLATIGTSVIKGMICEYEESEMLPR